MTFLGDFVEAQNKGFNYKLFLEWERRKISD
jgi:hypothetical protein